MCQQIRTRSGLPVRMCVKFKTPKDLRTPGTITDDGPKRTGRNSLVEGFKTRVRHRADTRLCNNAGSS